MSDQGEFDKEGNFKTGVGTEHLIVGAQQELAEAKAEIARLQKALREIAAIEYMGPYVGERVNDIIAASQPWSEPPVRETE